MTGLDRRRFLVGSAAVLGLAAVRGSGASLLAQAAAPAAKVRIDIHHHFAPPA